MKQNVLRQIKYFFQQWCSELSLNEIASNPQLIAAIEQFERSLVAKCAEE